MSSELQIKPGQEKLQQPKKKNIIKRIGNDAYNRARDAQKNIQDWLTTTCAFKMLIDRAEEITTEFEHYIPPGSKVLDVGAAFGFYEKPITTRGHTFTGLDVYRPKGGLSDIVVYDGVKIPFPDQHFDVAIIVTVLHHVHDTDALMKEVWRVTKSRVIIVEDVYHSRPERWWIVYRDVALNVEYLGHPCGFRKTKEWIEYFKRFNFHTIHSHEWYTGFGAMKILQGLLVLEPNGEQEPQ